MKRKEEKEKRKRKRKRRRKGECACRYSASIIGRNESRRRRWAACLLDRTEMPRDLEIT